MKLKFRHQPFQADAAKAVCDVFAGQPFRTPTYMIDSGLGQRSLFQTQDFTGFSNAPIVVSDEIGYLPDYNYSNYQNFLYPQITKVSSLFNSVLAKTNSGFKLMVGYYVGQISDSLLISDTLHKPVVTMGNGILDWPASLQAMVWTVFNKDSAGYSMLYAFGKKIYISSVNQIGNEMPSAYILHQNYPNPFNPSTKINFAIPKEGFVSLKIYDMLGREIKTLFNDNLKAGTYTIDFNAGLLTSGIYFYKLQSGTFTDVHKMILLK